MTVVEKFLESKRSIWILLTLHFCIWLSVFSVLDVHPDMADHWIWSRFLHFGYFEHPPMVALTMRILTMWGGNTVMLLKIGSVLFSVIILYMAFRLALVFFDRKTAMIFVLVLESTPYYSAGSVFWHIDQPYMVFWLVCMIAVAKFMQTENANWMLLFGVSAGLGAMSKYIMILLPIGMLPWCLINRNARVLLTRWQTYLGALIALLIISPNIYWNYQHEWVTFNFVLEKGLTGASFGVHFMHFFVSQFVLFSIVYSVYFWWKTARREINAPTIFGPSAGDRQKWQFLMFTGVTVMVFFALTSFLGSRTDPHWVNVAYFSFFLLLARFLAIEITQGQIGKQITLFVTSNLITYALLAFILIQIHFVFFPLHLPDAPSIKVLAGWDETASRIKEVCKDNRIEVPDFVISREYQLSSVLGLYMKHQPIPHSIEKEMRNLWSPMNEVKRRGAILVCPPVECRGVLEDAEERFDSSFRYLGEVRTQHFGQVLHKLKIFYLAPR